MKIETYEIEDASSEASAMANDAEALELINKLGLKGQQSIMNKDTVTRIPYRAMEATELLVYKALCDATTTIENYSAEPIPVRVLQVASHARDTGMFAKLEIWYPQVAKIDDPLLVGVVTEKIWPDHENPAYRHYTRDKFFLLARWGKTLLPFEQLEAMALKFLKTRRQSALAKAISEAKAALSALDDTNDLATLSAGVSFTC